MHLGEQHDPELEPKRAKTLFISICIHLALFTFLALNPDFLVQAPKRIIRIAGQDYDASKLMDLALTTPNTQQPRPKPPAPSEPMVQPPQQQPPPQAAPPPPPPPPPPPKESPAITPDMTLAEGARLDGTPKPSQGNTAELKAGSSGNPDASKPQPPKSEPKGEAAQQNPNTNPNALTLRDLAAKVLQQQSPSDQRRYPNTQGPQGPRTGIQNPNVQENPDFSTEEPRILSPTYGYDFGPYLNQVLNRIKYNWYALIPEIAKFKKGKVVIIFTITQSGVVANPRIAAQSGTNPLDLAAYGSITASNPFPRIPADFSGDHLDLQITFLYNIQ